MELPKNVTQIGEVNRDCKIYVEDYVVSYMKQLNQIAVNKELAVALYGIRKVENDITYLFVYGACKLDFLQREARHLSQAQKQEIEGLRMKYFADCEFQGYRLLNGEMVEGFHICEQDICRYIKGYAQFYEKNDNMLAYMLDVRLAEAVPEVVPQEKYEAVRKRQEERKVQYESGEDASIKHYDKKGRSAKTVSSTGLRRMRVSTVAVFVLLCIVGFATLGQEEGAEELQVAARQVMSSLTEQQLPDVEQNVNSNMQTNTLLAEDKLTEAVRQENMVDTTRGNEESAADTQGAVISPTEITATGQESVVVPTEATATGQESVIESTEATATGQESVIVPAEATIARQESVGTPLEPEASLQEKTDSPQEIVSAAQPVGYVIQQGDTLIGISVRQYGTDTRVADICALNQISDPDDIKIGQKILLP